MIFKPKTLSTILKYVLLISIFIANAYIFGQILSKNLLGFVIGSKKVFKSLIKYPRKLVNASSKDLPFYIFPLYLNELPTALVEISASTQSKS